MTSFEIKDGKLYISYKNGYIAVLGQFGTDIWTVMFYKNNKNVTHSIFMLAFGKRPWNLIIKVEVDAEELTEMLNVASNLPE